MVRITSGTPILAHFPHFFAFNGQKVPQIHMYSQNWIKYQILFRSNVSKLSLKIDILRTFWPSMLKEGQFLAKKSEKVTFLFFD